MGNFLFDGRNSIWEDLISQLPQGTSYLKDKNIIPFCNNEDVFGVGFLAYTEYFDSTLYAIGTDVKIYINDQIFDTVKILPTHTIYKKFNTPYGSFKLRTEIAGVTYREEIWIATNIYTFFMVLAQTYNYDYRRLMNIFGNIKNEYLQDNMLFPKIGWFYDFDKPTGWSYEDYRKVLTGYDSTGGLTYEPMNKLFLTAMTEYAIKELCRSFTGVYPTWESYRDIDGWVLIDDTLASSAPAYWEFDNYYLLDGVTGNRDISALTLNGLTLDLTIKGVAVNITFTAPTTATDIINQINAAIAATSLGSDVIAEIRTYTYDYLTGTTLNQYLHFNNTLETGLGEFNEGEFIVEDTSTALVQLGLETGEMGIIEAGDKDEICTIYDEQYHNNNIILTVHKGYHSVLETVTRTGLLIDKDKLKHRYVLNTVAHPFPITITGTKTIAGVPTPTIFNITTDYTIFVDPLTLDNYIQWLILANKPDDNTTYDVQYFYYINDDISELIKKIIPAYLQVEEIYSET